MPVTLPLGNQVSKSASLLGYLSNDGANIIIVDETNPLPIGMGSLPGAPLEIEGNVAHDAVDSGKPVKIGGVAQAPDSLRAAVAVLDRTDASYDLSGRAIVYLGTTLDRTNDGVTASLALAGTAVTQAVAALDSTGSGIPTAAMVAQFDDASVSTVTENQFAQLRMGSDRVLYVGGPVAHDAADSGNPLKIGGKVSSSLPTSITAGDRSDVLMGLNGQLMIGLAGAAPSDGATGASFPEWAGNARVAAVGQWLFNGVSTFDRNRNNHEVTGLTSAARTASVNTATLVNYNAPGVVIVIDVTAGGGAGSLTAVVKGLDTLSGKFTTILTSAAITTTGTTTLVVYPGVTIAANVAASAPLPRLWRIEITAADATSYTYSIGCNYVNG